MNPSLLRLLSCLFLSSAAFAQVAPVVTDQARVSGSRAINPPGALDVVQSATGATDPYELMATAGFAAIQDFSALTGDARDGAVFRYTQGTAPDVRLRFISNPANVTGTAHLNHAHYSTSPNSAFRVLAGAGRVVTLRVDFGRQDAASDRFTPVAAGSGVVAAGFTLSGAGLKRVNESGIAIRYLDATGRLISGQSMDTSGDVLSFYSGRLVAPGKAPIASIEIQFQFATDGAASIGLDDLGFSDLVTQR